MPDNFPRVLVLTKEIPQSVYAGCQQLFRAFQGYPADKLFVLGPAPEKGANILPCRYATLRLGIHRWVNSRFHTWANFANVAGLVRDFRRGEIERLLDGFQPEVVFTVMDLFSYYKIAWLYARDARVPLVTTTMDDPMHFQKVAPWAKSIHKQAVRRIYQDASLSLGVSREMSEWIDQEFGKPTEAFYFGPPDDLAPRDSERNRELRNPPQMTVGFAGSLHFYGRELQRLMPAFEQTGTRLNFYGMKTHELPPSPAVVDRGMWPIDELWSVVQAECDVLILPYPGDGWLENVFRTHFPTKLSEYLWQGMPVIITGPEYATGLRWGMRHPESCMALPEPTIGEFARVLEQLDNDAGLRQRLGDAAVEAARVEFEPAAARAQFQRHLAATVGRRAGSH